MRLSTTALLRGAAFALGVAVSAAGGCSLTTLDVLQCRTDADCEVALDGDHLCSQDGYCRALPDEPGRCSGVIEVRVFAELSGPLRNVGIPYFKGEIDLLREINDEGGIRGCPIVVKAADYGYDEDRAIEVYDAWVAEPTWPDVITVFGFGTPDTKEISEDFPEQGIVGISASYSGELATPRPVSLGVKVPSVNVDFEIVRSNAAKTSTGFPNNYFAGTDYSTGGRAAMEFINQQGAEKVAFIACDNDFCQDPMAAIKTYALDELELGLGRELTVEFVWTTPEVEDAVLGFFAEEMAQKEADPNYVIPDWVWVANATSSAAEIGAAIGRVREEMGLDVKVIANNWGFDENVFALCRGGCVDYFYGIMPFAAYGDSVPGMDKLMEIHDKWRAIDAAGYESNPPEVDGNGDPLTYENVRYVQGYVSVLMWRAAMERVVDQQKSGDANTQPALRRPVEHRDTRG
ncbi:MAG: ABC transporter substrate-binding protein, partial [Myxococcota bacterium]